MGHAHQNTTGVAKMSDNHCHPANCHAGTMANAITGTVRAIDTHRRTDVSIGVCRRSGFDESDGDGDGDGEAIVAA